MFAISFSLVYDGFVIVYISSVLHSMRAIATEKAHEKGVARYA
jgi:hypothetical protein